MVLSQKVRIEQMKERKALSPADVACARRDYLGGTPMRELSYRYGVSIPTVSAAIQGRGGYGKPPYPDLR